MAHQVFIEIKTDFNAQGVMSAEAAIKQLGASTASTNQQMGQQSAQASRVAGEGYDKLGKSADSSSQSGRALRSGMAQVAAQLGLTGPAANVAAEAFYNSANGLTATTGAALAAGVGLSAIIGVIKAAAEEKQKFNDAFRKGDLEFFISEMDRMTDAVQTNNSAWVTAFPNITKALAALHIIDPDLVLTQGKLAEKIQAYADALARIKADKVDEVTRKIEQQIRVLAAADNPIAKLGAEQKNAIDDAIKELGKLGASSQQIQATIAKIRQVGALEVGSATKKMAEDQAAALSSLQSQLAKGTVDALTFARSQGEVDVDLRGATVAMIEQERAAQLLAATNAKILTPALKAAIDQAAAKKISMFDNQETARSQQQAAAIEKIIQATQNEITALTSGAAAVEHMKIEQDKLSLSQQFGAEAAAKITAARHEDLNVLLQTKQAIDDVRVAGEALERQQQEDAALATAGIAKQLDQRQKLADFELQKLGAAGAPEALIAQRRVELLQAEQQRLASKPVISPEENQRMIDLQHQTELAQIQLQRLGTISIDVGKHIGQTLSDVFTAMIQGTLKGVDLAKTASATLGRIVTDIFQQVITKKLSFEAVLFTNLKELPGQANSALSSGASSVPGGSSGGGGGILDMIMGLFKSGGPTTTTSNGGGTGGGGILDTIMGLFKGGGSTSSSGGGLGGLFGGGGGGGGMLDSIMGMFGGSGGSAASGAGAGAGWTGGFDAWDSGGFGGATSGGGMGGMAGGALAGVMSLVTAAFTGGFKKGSLGGTIGGTIGAIAGSYFGPIGSMIGYMLGKLLGGLFDSVVIPTAMIKIKTAFTGLNPTPFGFQVGEAVSKVLKASNVPKAFQEGIRSQTETIAEETVGAIGDILNIMPKVVQRAIEPLVSKSNATVEAMLAFKISAPITEFAAKVKKFMSNLSYQILAAYGDPLIEALRLQLERTGLPFPTFAPSEQFVSTKTKKGDVAIGPPTDLPSEFIDNMFHYLQSFKQKQRAEKLPDVMDAIQKVFEVANNLEAVSRIMTLEQKQNIAAGFTNVLQAGSPKEVEVDLARFQRQFGPTLKFLEEAQQQSADLFGRGIVAALEAASESEAKLNFLKTLGDGAQQMLFEGIANAFVQAAQFQDFLAPMQQIIHKFAQDAIETGQAPDMAAFRTALLPLIEDFSTRAELLAPLIAELQKFGFDVKELLKGLTLGGANIVININGNVNNEQDARTIADLIFQHLDNSLPPPS